MKKMMLTMGIAIVIIVTLIAGCSNTNNTEAKVGETHSYQEIAEAYASAEGYDFTDVEVREIYVNEDGNEWMRFTVYDGETPTYAISVDVGYAESFAF